MQARYYDPVIGRFYSNDPVGFTGDVTTFNRYSYVGNNPYKYTDPDGQVRRLAFRAMKNPARTVKKAYRSFKKFLQRNGIITPTPKPVEVRDGRDPDVPMGDSDSEQGTPEPKLPIVDSDGNVVGETTVSELPLGAIITGDGKVPHDCIDTCGGSKIFDLETDKPETSETPKAPDVPSVPDDIQ